MAKIEGTLDGPRLRRQKGQPIVRENRGQLVVQAWPRKATRAENKKAEEARTLFYLRTLVMKYCDPAQIAMSYEMMKGTPYLPRDLLLMAMSGTMFKCLRIDGKKVYAQTVVRDVSRMLDYIEPQ